MTDSDADRSISFLSGIPEGLREAHRPLRVLLIQPPARGGVVSLLAQVDEESEGIGYKPPLGLLYLGTTIVRNTDHELQVMDCIPRQMDIAEVIQEAAEYEPDLIGISAWTDFWYPAYQIGKGIKRLLPHAHLVYGGPHIGIYPGETLKLPFVDSVVLGDGEAPFLCLANMLANRDLSHDVPGLHLKESWGPSNAYDSHVQKDMDALPIVDRTLVPLESYGSVVSKGGLVTTMITSRGCPYHCTFCKLNFQKTLCSSANRVVDEFEAIARLGIAEVEVYDDTFTWSKHRVLDICSGIRERGIAMRWMIRDRVDRAQPALLNAMFEAGCRRVHYGIESGVNSVLERMGKHTTTDQARNAVKLAKDAGMTVLTYFMLGNLDETVDDMRRTIDFAMELDAHYCEFSITMPYPGTEMYREALSSGLISHDYWLNHARNPTADFVPPEIIENYADRELLVRLRNEAIQRFYFRPKYVLRQCGSLASWAELKAKARMAYRLFSTVRS